MDDFTRELDELGPLGEGEGLDADTLKRELETVSRMVPQLKILAREKLQVKVKSEEAYAELFANEKVVKLLDDFIADPASSAEELPAYYIDPDNCVGCQICMKKCPIQAIDGGKKTIHVIDQEHVHPLRNLLPRLSAAHRRGAEDHRRADSAPSRRGTDHRQE